MTTVKNKMRPVHPGEILREEFLVPLGLSAHALAMALKVPAPRINNFFMSHSLSDIYIVVNDAIVCILPHNELRSPAICE